MASFRKNVDSAFAQGLQKGLSRRAGLGLSFEGPKERGLRSGEGFASHAGRPFLQHELSRSLCIHDHESLTYLARFHNHRLSPTRHVDVLPLINVAFERRFPTGGRP